MTKFHSKHTGSIQTIKEQVRNMQVLQHSNERANYPGTRYKSMRVPEQADREHSIDPSTRKCKCQAPKQANEEYSKLQCRFISILLSTASFHYPQTPSTLFRNPTLIPPVHLCSISLLNYPLSPPPYPPNAPNPSQKQPPNHHLPAAPCPGCATGP